MKTHHTKLKIETLSPVSIGDGEFMSPVSDYVYNAEEEQVHYLDKQKMENIFAEDREMLDDYTARVFGQAKKRKDWLLADFLTDYDRDYDDLTRKKVEAYIPHAVKEVETIIKTQDRPFIPGSSLKGAIRTAIFYNWLKENQNNDFQFLKQQIESKDRKKINNVFNKIDANIFGDTRERLVKNDAARIRISDTQPVDYNSMIILENHRHYLDKDKEKLVMLRECLKEEKTFTTTLSIEDGFTNGWLKFLQGENLHGLFRKINTFAKDVMDYELKVHRENETFYSEDEPDSIIHFYESILQPELENNNSCIIPLGFGKAFFQNSVALLFAEDEALFSQYRQKFNKRPGQSLFPKTRLITETADYFAPMGWIKLRVDA